MMDIIRISAAVVLIVGAGLVHGAWTNRWGSSPALAALAARFESVPMVIGDWKATPFDLPPEERAMAGAVACLTRRVHQPQSRDLRHRSCCSAASPEKSPRIRPMSATRARVTP